MMTAYLLEHDFGSVELVLYPEYISVRTLGSGLTDKPHILDVPLVDLEYFYLVDAFDTARDSEFLLQFRENGKSARKRVFVNSSDKAFQELLDALTQLCPQSSLQQLTRSNALQKMGFVFWMVTGCWIAFSILYLFSPILKG